MLGVAACPLRNCGGTSLEKPQRRQRDGSQYRHWDGKIMAMPSSPRVMKRNISISIFFPTYNEEDSISRAVREAEAVLKNITDTYEVIIVDDGSTDSTPSIAERLAVENAKVRVVRHYRNQGYGAALWSGLQASRYEYVFFTDADLQFDLSELTKLTDFVPEYEVVLGYRAPRRDPFMRLLNAWGWNKLNRLLFGLKVRDIDCAFKLFKRTTVASLPLKARGAMISAEMLIRLSRKGVVWKEVPVTHVPRQAGVATGAKPSVIIRAFKELFFMYRGELGSISRFWMFKRNPKQLLSKPAYHSQP